MKKIQLLVFVFFLSITGLALGQEVSSITFNTTLDVGSNITLSFNADAVDRPDIWIDWNHNGARDEGEAVTPAQWGHWGQRQVYTLKSQKVTIYGNVKMFGANANRITDIDVTKNTHLTYLYVQTNQLKSLDLTGQTDIYHLQLSENQMEGVLDVSNLSKLEQLNIDRNNLTGLIMGTHPVLRQLNFTRNFFSSETIDHILSAIPAQPGGSGQGNFYCMDTRTSWSQFAEGTKLKQHHLDHPVFQGRWAPLDVRTGGKTRLTDISSVTNLYKISFTTGKEAGAQISLHIDAEEIDRNYIWIDLNGNGTKDSGEEVTTFGSDASYTVSAQDITIYGPVTGISSSENDLTKFDFLQNAFFNDISSINLSDNKLTELNLTANYLELLEDLNIAGNNLTTSNITNIINKLADRSSTTEGTLTLLNLEGVEGNMAVNDHVTMADAKNYAVKDGAGNTLSANDIPLRDQSLSALENIETYQANEILLPEKTDQGLAITYTIETGKDAVATLEGNKVNTLRHGDVKITATQTGDSNYNAFTKTITITVLPAGDVFNWLEMPTISVIGNYVTLVGPEEYLSHFTKLYVNDEEVEMDVDYTYELTGETGTLELKATSEDGTYMMRIIVEK